MANPEWDNYAPRGIGGAVPERIWLQTPPNGARTWADRETDASDVEYARVRPVEPRSGHWTATEEAQARYLVAAMTGRTVDEVTERLSHLLHRLRYGNLDVRCEGAKPFRRVGDVFCVECPDCLFTFDARHTDPGGGYTCECGYWWQPERASAIPPLYLVPETDGTEVAERSTGKTVYVGTIEECRAFIDNALSTEDVPGMVVTDQDEWFGYEGEDGG
jgi:hypothetical protein